MTAESVEFDRYSVVLHASAEVARKVFSYREAIGMPDLASEPHVSLVGLRAAIDVGAVKRVLRTVASRHSPIQVVYDLNPSGTQNTARRVRGEDSPCCLRPN